MRRGANTQRGLGVVAWLIFIVILGGLLFAGYIWTMLSWSYSDGDRVGWMQKLSRKGVVCKTWEGELAMVSMPGTLPEMFTFTVRDERVAERINAVLGKRVALKYEEHMGLPSSCFGETRYFVTAVQVVDQTIGGPLTAPAPPVPAPAEPPAKPQGAP